MQESTGIAILSNAIFSNTGLGIDLDGDGVTANDPNDSDTGANNRQNFPLLSPAISSGGRTTVRGVLKSTPNSSFTVEVFSNDLADPSGFGEGQTFLGAASVTTDSAGHVSFTIVVSSAVPIGHFITATATDPARNTSEFSAAAGVGGSCSLFVSTNSDGGPGSLREAITCANAIPGPDTIHVPAGVYTRDDRRSKRRRRCDRRFRH